MKNACNLGGSGAWAAMPPTSEVPVCEPTPLAELVAPHPTAPFGGMDNVPEALMPEAVQVSDELDYAGLEQELPGEDRAHAPAEPRRPR